MFSLLIPLQTSQGNPLGSIVMILALFVVFYFFMIRPQQKRQKEMKKFREGISKGDKIVTSGGIFGKIADINEKTFVVEIAPSVKITVDKGSVYPSAAEADAQNQAK